MISVLFVLLSAGSAYAANNSPLEEQWNVTIHENEDDYISSIITSESRNYIVAGTMGSGGSTVDSDAFLAAIDQNGDILWNSDFGGDQQDLFSTVIDNGEQGFLVIGNTISFGSGLRAAWVVNVDGEGNELWNKTVHDDSFAVYAAQKTSDGGFVSTGLRIPMITAGGNLVALLLKADSEGNEQWCSSFGSGRLRMVDYLSSVQETPDGSFIMAGTTNSYSSSNMQDGWLVKADSEGNEVWNKSFGDLDIDNLQSVVVTDDGYIAVGKSKPYGESLFNSWAVKTDNDGNLLWEKTYFEGSDSYSNSIIEVSDGNYIIAGLVGNVPEGSVQASFGVDNYQGFLMKIDENGDEVWSYVYNDYSDSAFITVIESNGNYVAGGSMIPDGADERDSLLVVFNDPELQKYQATEDESTEESGSTTEKSPLSFTVTLVSIGLSFIALKKRL